MDRVVVAVLVWCHACGTGLRVLLLTVRWTRSTRSCCGSFRQAAIPETLDTGVLQEASSLCFHYGSVRCVGSSRRRRAWAKCQCRWAPSSAIGCIHASAIVLVAQGAQAWRPTVAEGCFEQSIMDLWTNQHKVVHPTLPCACSYVQDADPGASPRPQPSRMTPVGPTSPGVRSPGASKGGAAGRAAAAAEPGALACLNHLEPPGDHLGPALTTWLCAIQGRGWG